MNIATVSRDPTSQKRSESELRPNPGGGTIFRFTLPVVPTNGRNDAG
jgi:hypothetical protein